MHQGGLMVTLQHPLRSPLNLCNRTSGGWPFIRKSSSVRVACMIVKRALALNHISAGSDFDRLLSQMSLAIFPLRLTIMTNIITFGVIV